MKCQFCEREAYPGYPFCEDHALHGMGYPEPPEEFWNAGLPGWPIVQFQARLGDVIRYYRHFGADVTGPDEREFYTVHPETGGDTVFWRAGSAWDVPLECDEIPEVGYVYFRAQVENF